MTANAVLKTAKKLACVCVFSVTLVGCSGIDGIELNGGIFELTGLSGIGKKTSERQMPVRGPLVMPPTKNLPSPDQVATTGNPQQAWPNDPDKQRVILAQQKAELEKKRCEQGVFGKKTNDPQDFEAMTGQSTSSCDSILNKIINKNLPGRGTEPNPN